MGIKKDKIMVMIQVTEEKKQKMSELIEKMLHIGGKLMQCVEGLEEEEGGFHQGEMMDYMPEGGMGGMQSRMRGWYDGDDFEDRGGRGRSRGGRGGMIGYRRY